MRAIIVEDVTRRFPKEPRAAIDHVSFEVDDGAFVVLLGPSGCGKTTLLKMINRLYEPDSGRILIGGVDAQSLKVTELRRRIGYAIQHTGLFPHMRVEQNIAVVPRLLGWEEPRINARIDELLELCGLPVAYRARYPRKLSGGEQQRVGLARALAADPALMLMDEPFGALDAITRTRLQDELLRIQRKLRKTILFVTHDVEEALRLADKIIIMRAGAIVQYDTPIGIITRPRDDFVRELVGTEDMLRRLRLIPVSTALAARGSSGSGVASARPEPQLAPIDPGDDLYRALSQLLQSGADALSVVGTEGQKLGEISFDDIRAAARDKEAI